MLTKEQVQIESPCGVDFRNMTRATAMKRFCGECKKHVHDLTMMTEDEARAVLDGPSTGGLCVRYVADERGRLVFLPEIPTSRLTMKKRASLAALALAAPLSLTACMGSRMPDPIPPPPPTTTVEPTAQPPVQVPSSRSHYEVTRGPTRMRIADEPGMILDVAFPAPDKGRKLMEHPFVSGAFGGDRRGFDEAMRLLATSSNTPEFIAKLESAGFKVKRID